MGEPNRFFFPTPSSSSSSPRVTTRSTTSSQSSARERMLARRAKGYSPPAATSGLGGYVESAKKWAGSVVEPFVEPLPEPIKKFGGAAWETTKGIGEGLWDIGQNVYKASPISMAAVSPQEKAEAAINLGKTAWGMLDPIKEELRGSSDFNPETGKPRAWMPNIGPFTPGMTEMLTGIPLRQIREEFMEGKIAEPLGHAAPGIALTLLGAKGANKAMAPKPKPRPPLLLPEFAGPTSSGVPPRFHAGRAGIADATTPYRVHSSPHPNSFFPEETATGSYLRPDGTFVERTPINANMAASNAWHLGEVRDMPPHLAAEGYAGHPIPGEPIYQGGFPFRVPQQTQKLLPERAGPVTNGPPPRFIGMEPGGATLDTLNPYQPPPRPPLQLPERTGPRFYQGTAGVADATVPYRRDMGPSPSLVEFGPDAGTAARSAIGDVGEVITIPPELAAQGLAGHPERPLSVAAQRQSLMAAAHRRILAERGRVPRFGVPVSGRQQTTAAIEAMGGTRERGPARATPGVPTVPQPRMQELPPRFPFTPRPPQQGLLPAMPPVEPVAPPVAPPRQATPPPVAPIVPPPRGAAPPPAAPIPPVAPVVPPPVVPPKPAAAGRPYQKFNEATIKSLAGAGDQAAIAELDLRAKENLGVEPSILNKPLGDVAPPTPAPSPIVSAPLKAVSEAGTTPTPTPTPEPVVPPEPVPPKPVVPEAPPRVAAPPRGEPGSPERAQHIAWEHGQTWRTKQAKLDKLKNRDPKTIDWGAEWEADTKVRSLDDAAAEVEYFKGREQEALKTAFPEKPAPALEPVAPVVPEKAAAALEPVAPVGEPPKPAKGPVKFSKELQDEVNLRLRKKKSTGSDADVNQVLHDIAKDYDGLGAWAGEVRAWRAERKIPAKPTTVERAKATLKDETGSVPRGTGGKRFVEVRLQDGKKKLLRVVGEDGRFLRGIEVNSIGDEIVPKGPKALGATERLHMIEKGAIKSVAELEMDPKYGTLERVKSAEKPARVYQDLTPETYKRYQVYDESGKLLEETTDYREAHTWADEEDGYVKDLGETPPKPKRTTGESPKEGPTKFTKKETEQGYRIKRGPDFAMQGEYHVEFPDGRVYPIYRDTAPGGLGQWHIPGVDNIAEYTKAALIDRLRNLDESKPNINPYTGRVIGTIAEGLEKFRETLKRIKIDPSTLSSSGLGGFTLGEAPKPRPKRSASYVPLEQRQRTPAQQAATAKAKAKEPYTPKRDFDKPFSKRKPFKYFHPSVDQGFDTTFADWVNARRASGVEGKLKGREFKDLNESGMSGIKAFQSGYRSGRLKDVASYFDAKHTELTETGVKLGFREDYLPQLWDNTAEEIGNVTKRLGLKPTFTLERVLENYQAGIDAGLKPKFEGIGDLVGWYETRANKAIADRKFFDYLRASKKIVPDGKQQQGWKILNPDNFPVQKFKTKRGEHVTKNYYAPPEIATAINNYLGEGHPLGKWTADKASLTKNIVLSSGVPGTGLTGHGANLTVRHAMGRGLVKGGLEAAKWLVNPKSAGKWLDTNLAKAPDAVRHGLTLTTEEHVFGSTGNVHLLREPTTAVGKVANKGLNKLLKVQGKFFEDPLFQNIVPAMKLKHYSGLVDDFVKKGMDPTTAKKAAAKTTNELYGGINWEAMQRSRDVQNMMRTFILAPDWLETQYRIGKGAINTLRDLKNPRGLPYKRAASSMLGAYVAANVVNYAINGKLMFQNEPGHSFDIQAGEVGGKIRYIRPFGTAIDFARLPIDAASGLVQGDLSPSVKILKNRRSTIARPLSNLLMNTDDFGKPILGKDIYGRDRSVMRQLGAAGKEVGEAVTPQYVQGPLDLATGRAGSVEEAILGSVEAPVRYSRKSTKVGSSRRPERPRRPRPPRR